MPPEATRVSAEVVDSYVPVSQFFVEKAVFVTGGTGFLGKVLVEKLLRSCPGVKVIYLLMRPKRGLDLAARLTTLTNSPLFDTLKTDNPLAINKIVPVNGNLTLPDLGLSPADLATLIETVSVVFHSAATIRFDEPLKEAVQINVVGTKRLLELCHKMHDLQAFVHVSTCYSNCNRQEVQEMVYPPPYDPEAIIQCMKWMDDDLITAMTPKIIGKLPNTYTFTKALTETIVLKESANLPVVIVRPSIVIATWSEPVEGWVENLAGPTGIVAAYGKGLLRSMVCDERMVADLIPADIVINLMICAAWRTATARANCMTVYNCCSGNRRPITWRNYMEYVSSAVRRNPSSEMLWYPTFSLFSNSSLNNLYRILVQVLPAYAVDAASFINDTKPRMVEMQGKLKKGTDCLEFFATRQWRFRDENVQLLDKCLDDNDRSKFGFNVSEVDWPKCMESYALGVRKFILKEHPKTIEDARILQHKYLWIHRTFKLATFLLLLRMNMTRQVFRVVWNMTMRSVRMTPKFLDAFRRKPPIEFVG